MTRIDGVFIGTINSAYADQTKHLYFYFLGNRESGLTVGASTCTVSIADQKARSVLNGSNLSGLPVISAGISEERYDPRTKSYSCKLYNKCALFKYNVTKGANVPDNILTPLNVPYTKVTIDFSVDPNKISATDDPLTYSDPGIIELKEVAPGTTAVRYAVYFTKQIMGTTYTYETNYEVTQSGQNTVGANWYYNTETISITNKQ